MLLPLGGSVVAVEFFRVIYLSLTLALKGTKVAAFTRGKGGCFLRAMDEKRDLCSVTGVCRISVSSVMHLGPKDSGRVQMKRTLGVPRTGSSSSDGGKEFRAVRTKRALCRLAIGCGVDTRTVYSTGPNLDTDGFHIKRMVSVPARDIASPIAPLTPTRSSAPSAARGK